MAKEPYELSVWEDIVINSNGETHFSERKKAVIASSEFHSDLNAYDVTLKETSNGELSLNFSILYKYRDASGDLKDNPLFALLPSEQKLKLRLGEEYPYENLSDLELEDDDERWKDFIIKNIDKDSTKYTAIITAKEIFVNELGKNGWNVLLNTDLENNYGTLPELAEKVLDGSDWTVSTESYSPVEKITEPLMAVELISDVDLTKVIGSGSITAPTGVIIYPFYSDVHYDEVNCQWKLNDGNIQVLFNPLREHFGIEDVNDDRIVIDDNARFNYEVDANILNSRIASITMTGADLTAESFFGKKVEKYISSHYEKTFDKYVYDYVIKEEFKNSVGLPNGLNPDVVYGFSETNYVIDKVAQNLLTNSSNFTKELAWSNASLNTNSSKPLPDIFPRPVVYPQNNPAQAWEGLNSKNYLRLNFINGEDNFINEGPKNRKLQLVKDGRYILRFKGRWIKHGAKTLGENDNTTYENIYAPNNTSTDALYTLKFNLSKRTIGGDGTTFTEVTNVVNNGNRKIEDDYYTSGENIGFLKPYMNGEVLDKEMPSFPENEEGLKEIYRDEKGYGYVYFQALTSTEADDQIFLNIRKGDPIVGRKPIEAPSAIWDYAIEDIQLFEYYEDKNGNVIFPDDIPEAILNEEKTYYISYNDDIFYLAENDEYYEPIYNNNFESVRNIEVKESNYFNNIQSLAELFEVWVKFKIKHQRNGKLLYNENGLPQKEVIFSQYAPNGDVINYAGFKKGINLKGIKRIVDSNSIATKVIVKNNNQEFAVDGACSIARAVNNPTGENEIYNFNYFINQGLLDFSQTLRDLYGMSNSDFRFFPRLKALNNRYKITSEELQSCSNAIWDKQDELELYQAQIISFEAEIRALNAEIQNYQDGDSLKTQKQEALGRLICQKEWYLSVIDALTGPNGFIPSYQQRKEELGLELENILEEKKQLKLEFYRKYSRFIQEGTWTDESYIDDDLYYLDASKISTVSAYPKVSYTINTVEIDTIDEYSGYKFKIGDRTYLEDPEFFGYSTISTPVGNAKTPKKIEVIVSERIRNLDNPSKSTLTVKNYKNQFEELFQKITATTQALQYESGSYGRVAGILTSNGEINTATLEKSFVNNSLILSGANNQSVIFDTGSGIEVTNNENTNEKVRIVGAGIFVSNDGGATWTNGVSGAGINTQILLAGQIDASKINIMNGSIPCFRWDENGISAFKVDSGIYDLSKFVRYNQYGLYSTDGTYDPDQAVKDLLESDPNATYDQIIQTIKDNSTFSLTYKGLRIESSGDLSFQNNSITLTAEYGLEVFNGSTFNQEFLDSYSYITDPTGGAIYSDGDEIPIISLGTYFNTVGGAPYRGLRMRNSEGEITLSVDGAGKIWINDQLLIGGDFGYSTYEDITYGVGLNGKTITEEKYFEYIEDKRYALNLTNGIPDIGKENYLKQNSIRIWAGGTNNEVESALFFVLENGIVYASNAYIEGIIQARGGKFSGLLTVGENDANGIDGTFGSNQTFWAGKVETRDEETNEIIFTSYNFRVDGNGKLIANEAVINGEINANSGSIKKLTVGDNSGIGLDVVNQDDNIILWVNAQDIEDKASSKFYVTKNGELYTSKIYLKDSILIGAVDTNNNTVIDYYQAGINNEEFEIALWAGAISNNYNYSNFVVGYNGNVIAKSLDLGGGELKGNSATLSGILYLEGNNNTNGLIFEGGRGIRTNTFNQEGNIGWAIENSGDAYFNNIIARGELKTATFTYESKNMMGGDLLISPAYFFDSLGQVSVSANNEYIITFEVSQEIYEKTLWDKIDNKNPQILFNCILSNEEEYSGLHGEVEKDSDNKLKVILPTTINENISTEWEDITFVLPGSSLALQNGCGINLTAGDINGPAVIITDITNGSKIITQIGRLGQDSNGIGVYDEYFGELEGYGLYAQNAYITGKLFLPNAGITDESAEYSGSNKIGDGEGQNIRIWAGSDPSNKQTAPFVVTQDGSLYASKGIFAGQVIATDSTFSGWLNTAGILIDPEEDEDEIKQIFYVAYDNNNKTSNGFPLVQDRIIQIDKNGLSIWEGGISIFSDWSAGWRVNELTGLLEKTDTIEQLYGPTIQNGVENYSNIFPYIKAIDNQYHRLYVSEFHSNHFSNGNTNSIKIKDGTLQFSNYYNFENIPFLQLENESFNTSNLWNIELQENNLKIYPIDKNSEEGFLKFKNQNINDNKIEVEIQGLLEIKEELTLIKMDGQSKPKINFPEAIIQHYNNAENLEWDNGLDFMI